MAVLAAVGLVVAVPTALAIHDFTDVPDENPFHADISAVKGAGITSGKTCSPPGTPPTFCPSEPITREAMAAFVHRGFGRVAYDRTDVVDQLVDEAPVDLAVVTIQVGGTPGQTQFVRLDVSVNTFMTTSDGCPCYLVYEVLRDGGGITTFPRTHRHDLGAPGNSDFFSSSAFAWVPVASGSTHTFRVRAFRPSPSPGDIRGFAELSALTVPFGSSGTNSP